MLLTVRMRKIKYVLDMKEQNHIIGWKIYFFFNPTVLCHRYVLCVCDQKHIMFQKVQDSSWITSFSDDKLSNMQPYFARLTFEQDYEAQL